MQKLKQILFFILLIFMANKIYAQHDLHNAIFTGASLGQNISVGHTEFSLMVGYERYLETGPTISFGPFAEIAFSGEHTTGIFGISVGFYPVDVLKLWITPCFSYAGGGKHIIDANENSPEHFGLSNNFLLKFGIGYHLHFQNQYYSIMPFLEGNLIASEFILSAGVKFRYHF